MGQVFLGRSPGGRPVAVKLVRPDLADDPGFRRRFALEAEAARRVGGFYTAQLVDADPDADPPWLVTAYIPGPSLQQAVEAHGPMPRRPLPLPAPAPTRARRDTIPTAPEPWTHPATRSSTRMSPATGHPAAPTCSPAGAA